MNPMRFNRVGIIENGDIVERGYLNKMMPQSDMSYLYEIYGDSGKLYIVTEDKFMYISEEEDESERQG
jgi:hypothetical protein